MVVENIIQNIKKSNTDKRPHLPNNKSARFNTDFLKTNLCWRSI